MTTPPMPSPLIGITTYEEDANARVSLPTVYIEAVRRAGGIPLLIPPGEPAPDTLLSRLDGVLLSGGDDVAPDLYGGVNHPKVFNINHARDELEISIVHFAVERAVPLLGICRGVQVLNVALGGTLMEHLPDVVGERIRHQSRKDNIYCHPITVRPHSRLARILGTEQFELESWHHQAIRTPAPLLTVVAQAPDGIIEGVEMRDHPWLVGVQWHPERAASTNPNQQALFDSLVRAASRRNPEW